MELSWNHQKQRHCHWMLVSFGHKRYLCPLQWGVELRYFGMSYCTYMVQYSWVFNVVSLDASLQCAQVWLIRLHRIMVARFEILLLKPPKSVIMVLSRAHWSDWMQEVSVLGRKKTPTVPICLLCWAVYYDGLYLDATDLSGARYVQTSDKKIWNWINFFFFWHLILSVKVTAGSDKFIIKPIIKLVLNFLEAYIKFWYVTFKALKQYSIKQRKEVNVIWNSRYMQKKSNSLKLYLILFYFYSIFF